MSNRPVVVLRAFRCQGTAEAAFHTWGSMETAPSLDFTAIDLEGAKPGLWRSGLRKLSMNGE